jgi:formyltetrahydrofolate-dependent phosphoribosylglycinamide formyltransferase
LKQKWKVNGTQLLLILCVFAITGTTTAWLTRQITYWLNLQSTDVWYWILKIIMLVFGYQMIIIIVSLPFGQFNFFWKFEKKILRSMKILKPEPSLVNRESAINIAIFASGTGTNAQKIIDHFKGHSYIKIALIVCNKPGAGVLTIADKEQIPALIIDKEQFFRGNGYVDEMKKAGIDFIVLAGFLWKIPVSVVQAFPQRIINIHPALLPNYGGKGMYGRFVHEAVIAAKDPESGISIHFVDELYDHGQLIFQARCTIDENDTPDTLAQKIHALEHAHYPLIVEKVISELQNRR